MFYKIKSDLIKFKESGRLDKNVKFVKVIIFDKLPKIIMHGKLSEGRSHSPFI